MAFRSLQSYKTLPKLIVFDLDYTLWPLWVDTHVDPPFQRLENGNIRDRHGTNVKLNNDVVPILNHLKSHGIPMAIASRTEATRVAESLLDIMELNEYFSAKEIYPGSKVTHFFKLKEHLKLDFSNMLFFDDEERNIRDLTRVGVTAIHAPDGLNWNLLNHGLSIYSQTHQ